jgi:hypothetical protein
MKLGGNFGYIGDTDKHGDAFNPDGDWDNDSDGDNDNVGWEFDVGANVNLYKNLLFTCGFGYLIAGDAIEKKLDENGVETKVDDPWTIIGNLRYSF